MGLAPYIWKNKNSCIIDSSTYRAKFSNSILRKYQTGGVLFIHKIENNLRLAEAI